MRLECDVPSLALELAQLFQVDLDIGVFLDDESDLVNQRLQAGSHRSLLDCGDETDVAHVEIQGEDGFEGAVEPAQRGFEFEVVELEEVGVEGDEEAALVLEVEVVADGAEVLLEHAVALLAELFELLNQALPDVFHGLAGDDCTFDVTVILLELPCVAKLEKLV